MTRRTIVFTDTDGTKYATPEFNGDKSEFTMFLKNPDACDADWPNILAEFDGVQTLTGFKTASHRAQLHYRSFINNLEVEREILPVYEVTDEKMIGGHVITLN